MAHVLLTRVFPWLMLLFGLYFMAVGTWDAVRAVSSSSWPIASGVVTRSEIEFQDDPRIGKPGSHRPSVDYEYLVDGQRYTSSRIRVVTVGTSRRSDAESVLQDYPVGSPVSVHYHPRHPNLAYLEVGFSWDLLPTLGLGFLPFALGLAFLTGFKTRPGTGSSTPV